MQDVTFRRAELEEVEKKSLRAAMIEERMRYCSFVHLLQPVVKEECEVMYELGHLQEVMQCIAIVTKDPNLLPQSSEELILESKSSYNLYPESPGGSNSQGCSNSSLGSRKSSVCSISSMNSSGSSGSPGHQFQRSLSQVCFVIFFIKAEFFHILSKVSMCQKILTEKCQHQTSKVSMCLKSLVFMFDD